MMGGVVFFFIPIDHPCHMGDGLVMQVYGLVLGSLITALVVVSEGITSRSILWSSSLVQDWL